MSERERLIELLIKLNGSRYESENIADYLLDNGVRLPVTCGECEYNDLCMTDFNGFGRKDFDFCPYGERRAE